MPDSPSYLAIDLGASSGRAVVGTLCDGVMETREVHRFRTPLVEEGARLYWDHDALWEEVRAGLAKALDAAPGLRSVSVDSWAVDYVPLGAGGEPVRRPYAYRDPRVRGRLAESARLVGGEDALYDRTGIQFLDFNTIALAAKAMPVEAGFGTLSLITLLLFIGATGKSAQIPLYTWLPDAMEGPTPVSALIHAATMVTAGVYMIGRNAMLFEHAPATLQIIAIIGAATALFAGTIGLVQNDIKRVLAYSTVSQLGYMFLAMGVGAYGAGIFHLYTHAFFKACLFLGSGAVIHALHGEQDIRNMGGLKKYIPITYWTFVIASVAIAGVPLLSGFFSKDEILFETFVEGHQLLWGVGAITSLMLTEPARSRAANCCPARRPPVNTLAPRAKAHCSSSATASSGCQSASTRRNRGRRSRTSSPHSKGSATAVRPCREPGRDCRRHLPARRSCSCSTTSGTKRRSGTSWK